MWYYVPGQGYVNDTEGEYYWGGAEGVRRLPEYSLTYQFPETEDQSGSRFQWEPGAPMPAMSYSPTSYIPKLIELADKADAGQLNDLERWEWEDMRAQALAIPTRDLSRLTSTAQGGYWTGIPEGADEAWMLTNDSPDVGALMLGLRDKVRAGTASAQEREVFDNVARADAYQNWVASVPQPSDAFSPMGNELFGALATIGIGTGLGAFAAAPLTLGGIAGAAGAASGLTGMLGEALDEQALKQVSMVLGLAGGATGLLGAATGGIASFGDALKLAQKVYGVGNKAYQVAQQWSGQSGPDDPAAAGLANPEERLYSMDPSYATTQRGQGDAGTRGRGDAATAGGSGMAEAGTFDQISQLVAGLVGAAGSALSLADVKRYMDQLSEQYEGQKGVRDFLNQAYVLASERVNVQQAQTQEDYQRRLERYQQEQERFNTHYADLRQEQAQRQEAYGLYQQQLAADRQRIATLSGEDRQRAIEAYQERAQQVRDDRAFKRGIFSDDRNRFLQAYEQQQREAAETRGMDLESYRARQQIGAGLRDPAQIAAGAQGIYQPLSTLAREMISRDTQGEMAMRGVSPEGQYANIMSARAFAPLEQQMWQNALQGWLQSQQTAAGAYQPIDVRGTPTYNPLQTPDFALGPEYRYQPIQELPTTDFRRVPGAVGWQEGPQRPEVPGAVLPPTNVLQASWSPKPYEPFGSTAATGGGQGGAIDQLGRLVGNLTKEGGLLSSGGALAGLLGKLLGWGGGGDAYAQFTGWGQPYGPGSSGDPAFAGNDDPYAYLYENPDFGDFMSMPYDNWSYGPTADMDFANMPYDNWSW